MKLILPILIITSFAIAFVEYLNIPIVYKSNTTGKCAYVEIEGKRMTCEAAKGTYETVWIK